MSLLKKREDFFLVFFDLFLILQNLIETVLIFLDRLLIGQDRFLVGKDGLLVRDDVVVGHFQPPDVLLLPDRFFQLAAERSIVFSNDQKPERSSRSRISSRLAPNFHAD